VPLNSNINLTWERPTDVALDDIIRYDIYYGLDQQGMSIVTDINTTSSTFALTQDMVGKTFRVIARLTNADGSVTYVQSVNLSINVPTPTMPSPTGLIATVTDRTLNASWDPVSGAISYRVIFLGNLITVNTNSCNLPIPLGIRSDSISVTAISTFSRSQPTTIPVTGFTIAAPEISVTPITQDGRGFDITIVRDSDDLRRWDTYIFSISNGMGPAISGTISPKKVTYQYRNIDLPPSANYTVSVRINAEGSLAATQTGISLPVTPATLLPLASLQAAAVTQTLGGITVPTVSVKKDAISDPVVAPILTAPAITNSTDMTAYLNKIIITTQGNGGIFVTNHIINAAATERASVGIVADHTKNAVITSIIGGNSVTITIGTKNTGIKAAIIGKQSYNLTFGLPDNYKLVFSNFDTSGVTTAQLFTNAFYKVMKPSVTAGQYTTIGSDFLSNPGAPFCLPITIVINSILLNSNLIYKNIQDNGKLAPTSVLQYVNETPSGITMRKKITGEIPKNTIASDNSKTTYSAYLISNSLNVAERCFLGHTRIATPAGLCPVETLTAGDLVLTDDRREVPIRQIYKTILKATEKTAPYKFEAGSIVTGYPRKAFEISPDHAVAVPGGWLFPRYAHLAGVNAEQTRIGEEITYYHIELPNYMRDNLVIEGGTVVESDGEKWLSDQANPDTSAYVFNRANGLFRRLAITPIRAKPAAGGAGARN
jgi:hypothetical protein